jgi:hypothetical protein
MFIRVYRHKEQKELLINTNSIWKIEVSYARRGERDYHLTTLATGIKDPNAVRVDEVYVGSEVITMVAAPGDPVVQVIEDIYNKAVKGLSENQDGPEE